MINLKHTLTGAATALVLAGAAAAQTGPSLLMTPWEEGRFVESRIDAAFQNRGHIRGTNTSFQLNTWDGQARWRLDADDPHSPALGYRITYLDISSDALPPRLVDQALGVSFGVGEFDGWQVGAALGIGYAGNNPFADSRALYGQADLVATRQLDEHSTLTLSLNYHGNRTIWPDIPLPGVAYSRSVGEDLRYTVGVPISSIYWRPLPALELDFRYIPPFTLDAEARYLVTEGFTAFAALHNRHEAFTIDGQNKRRRAFFRQRRVEGGVRVQVVDRAQLTVAGGYAFGQRFSTGWDVRNLDNHMRVSSEPYIRAALAFAF